MAATIHGKFDLDLRGKKVEGLAEATVAGDAVRFEDSPNNIEAVAGGDTINDVVIQLSRGTTVIGSMIFAIEENGSVHDDGGTKLLEVQASSGRVVIDVDGLTAALGDKLDSTLAASTYSTLTQRTTTNERIDHRVIFFDAIPADETIVLEGNTQGGGGFLWDQDGNNHSGILYMNISGGNIDLTDSYDIAAAVTAGHLWVVADSTSTSSNISVATTGVTDNDTGVTYNASDKQVDLGLTLDSGDVIFDNKDIGLYDDSEIHFHGVDGTQEAIINYDHTNTTLDITPASGNHFAINVAGTGRAYVGATGVTDNEIATTGDVNLRQSALPSIGLGSMIVDARTSTSDPINFVAFKPLMTGLDASGNEENQNFGLEEASELQGDHVTSRDWQETYLASFTDVQALQSQVHQIEEELSDAQDYSYATETPYVDAFLTERTDELGTKLNTITVFYPNFDPSSNVFTTYARLTDVQFSAFDNLANDGNIIIGFGPDNTSLIPFQLVSYSPNGRGTIVSGEATYEFKLKMIETGATYDGTGAIADATHKTQFESWNTAIVSGIYYYAEESANIDTIGHAVGNHITGSALTPEEKVIVDNLTVPMADTTETVPGGDDALVFQPYDGAGGGVSPGQWYWRNVQTSGTIFTPTTWESLVVDDTVDNFDPDTYKTLMLGIDGTFDIAAITDALGTGAQLGPLGAGQTITTDLSTVTPATLYVSDGSTDPASLNAVGLQVYWFNNGSGNTRFVIAGILDGSAVGTPPTSGAITISAEGVEIVTGMVRDGNPQFDENLNVTGTLTVGGTSVVTDISGKQDQITGTAATITIPDGVSAGTDLTVNTPLSAFTVTNPTGGSTTNSVLKYATGTTLTWSPDNGGNPGPFGAFTLAGTPSTTDSIPKWTDASTLTWSPDTGGSGSDISAESPAGTVLTTGVTKLIAGANVNFVETEDNEIEIRSTAIGLGGGTVTNVGVTNGLQITGGLSFLNPTIGITDIPGLPTGDDTFPNATISVNSRGQVTSIARGIVETGTTAVFADTDARNAATDTYNGYVALITDEDNASYIFTGTRTLADVTTTPAISTDSDWTLLSNPAVALTQAQGDARYAGLFSENTFSSVQNYSAVVNLNGTTNIVDADVTALSVTGNSTLQNTTVSQITSSGSRIDRGAISWSVTATGRYQDNNTLPFMIENVSTDVTINRYGSVSGTHTPDWYEYLGVRLNPAEDAFVVDEPGSVYSDNATNPFAANAIRLNAF